MNAKDIKFKDLMEKSIQLQIPIYQRTYDWEEKHCRQIYDDIVSAGRNAMFHFIGAITSSGREEQPVDVPCYQVIDGQQRITTIMLLMRALKDADIIPDGIRSKIDYLLFNVGERNDGPDYYKLVMNEDDDAVFREIMENGRINASGSLAACYNHFRKWLSADHTGGLVWKGLQGLTAVSILLGERDNPQAIFESMNSTGLDLSETDLIQNYLLMGGDHQWQKRVYKKYWLPMERRFGGSLGESDKFFWCYLSMKDGRAVNKKAVYKTFKKYMTNRDHEEELGEIVRHYDQYVMLIDPERDPDHALSDEIGYACDQETDVANPLLLKVLVDRAAGRISDSDTKKIFVMVGSYLLRSRVCGTLTGSNRRFPEMAAKIERDRYVESVAEALLSIRGGGRFPRNEVFREDLERITLYTNRVCKYVLIRLNGPHREMAEPDRLTIEHIMPQNLDDGWKAGLGERHAEIHERYLHTIGNLTLTAYNSEFGNMPFPEKRKKYGDSMIAMTRALAEHGRWSEVEIKERARKLAERAVRIWQYPEGYGRPGDDEDEGQTHDLMLEEDYLDGRDTAELWKVLKEGIQAACPGAVFRMNKHYASFRLPDYRGSVGSVVCSMESLRSSIHVTYNTKIDDGRVLPSNFVRDVSGVGHYGPGDLRTTIASMDDVDRVVSLVRAVWDAKAESHLT